MYYNAKDLCKLMRIILARGMDINLNGFAFKHHSKNPSACKAPFKFNLCTRNVRPEGRLTPDNVMFMTKFLWDYIVRHDLWGLQKWGSRAGLPCIAGIPNVGDEIADGVWKHAQRDGITLPRVWLSKVGVGDNRHIGQVIREDDAARGLPVCTFDDLLTRGTSKEEPVEHLLKSGHKATDTFVVLDYELGGSAFLNQLGMRQHSIISVGAVFRYAKFSAARGEDLLKPDHLAACLSYMEAEQQSLRR